MSKTNKQRRNSKNTIMQTDLYEQYFFCFRPIAYFSHCGLLPVRFRYSLPQKLKFIFNLQLDPKKHIIKFDIEEQIFNYNQLKYFL